MKNTLLLPLLLLSNLFLFAKNDYPTITPVPDSIYEGLSFSMPKLPEVRFPKRTLSILDFGGIGDGDHDNTHAFSSAIDSLHALGGGHLIVPEGVWMTGPITLRDNIDLHLLSGAVIRFLGDKDLYPLTAVNFMGQPTYLCQSPISGKDLNNIAITGRGVIDGNGDVWRHIKRRKVAPQLWDRITKSGGIVDGDQWFPSESYRQGALLDRMHPQAVPAPNDKSLFEPIKDFLRPAMVSLVNCSNVILGGVTFQNSPNWCLHPSLCRNLRVSNVNVRNPSYSQNGDAIDIDACADIVIYNSTFDVGDDAICVKSGKDLPGRNQGVPSERIVIHGCTVFHAHGGFVVGSEMSGGVRNVSVTRCTFLGTDSGLRFKSCRGRGGVVENIFINHIRMLDILAEPIILDLHYQSNAPDEALDAEGTPALPKVDETTPTFKNIYISNVTCRNARRVLSLAGLPECPIENIIMQNLNITARDGAKLSHVRGLEMRYCRLDATRGHLLRMRHVRNATLIEVHSSFPERDVIEEDRCDSIRYYGIIAHVKH